MNMQTLKNQIRRFPMVKNILKKTLGIDKRNALLKEVEEKYLLKVIPDVWKRLGLDRQTDSWVQSFYPVHQPQDPVPTLERPISQACTLAQFQEPVFKNWCDRLQIEINQHRKKWEYVYIGRQLELAGMLGPGKTALGFGVGLEPLVPYFANQGVFVTATDLDLQTASDKGWVDTNQYSRGLQEFLIFPFANAETLKKQVKLRTADMNQIPEQLRKNQFDFVWSACAFEHLGSIEQGLQFIVNSLDCLAPNGIAVHTTELNLSSDEKTLDSGSTVLFRRRDFQELARRCREKGFEMNLSFHIGSQAQDLFYDLPPYSENFHAKLLMDPFITTSYGICLRRVSQ